MQNTYQEIYAVVCLIPKGQVATYGQIAQLIGRPRYARQVGYALAALPEGHEVPWHRVINAKGQISARSTPDYKDYQQILLEDEGIDFGLKGKINLSTYQWQPEF